MNTQNITHPEPKKMNAVKYWITGYNSKNKIYWKPKASLISNDFNVSINSGSKQEYVNPEEAWNKAEQMAKFLQHLV